MISYSTTAGKCYRNGAEITEKEYATAVSEIKAKTFWVNAIYNGTATIDDAPEDWRMEISQCVAARQAQSDLTDEDATDEDYQAALAELGVSV